MLILAALCFDLIFTNIRIDPTVKDYYPDLEKNAEVRFLASAPGRVYSRTIAADRYDTVRELYAAYRAALAPNTGTIAGVSYLNGIPFIALREQAVLYDLIDTQPPGLILARRLGFLGTPYVVTDDPAFGSSNEWESSATRLTDKLWRLNQSAPMLGFPARVVSLADWETFNAVNLEDFSNGHSVFIGERSGPAVTIQRGSINGYEDRPGRVNASVSTDTGGLLVLRQFAYPGWHVDVDGRETALVPTNRFFIGVNVPPGTHQVNFSFEPSHWRLGLALSTLGLLTMIAMLIAGSGITRFLVITSRGE